MRRLSSNKKESHVVIIDGARFDLNGFKIWVKFVGKFRKNWFANDFVLTLLESKELTKNIEILMKNYHCSIKSIFIIPFDTHTTWDETTTIYGVTNNSIIYDSLFSCEGYTIKWEQKQECT